MQRNDWDRRLTSPKYDNDRVRHKCAMCSKLFEESEGSFLQCRVCKGSNMFNICQKCIPDQPKKEKGVEILARKVNMKLELIRDEVQQAYLLH